MEPRFSIRVQAKLGTRAAAHKHEASPLAARHIGAIMIGDKILKQAAAERRRLAGLEESEILDKIGHALERPVGKSGGNCLPRLVVLLVYNGIDGRVDLVGASDRRLQHFPGVDLAFGN